VCTDCKSALFGVAGANWAGWQTAFVSRPGRQLFPLANLPEINEENILSVVKKLIAIRP
jgi:2-haloacid dehalogenase